MNIVLVGLCLTIISGFVVADEPTLELNPEKPYPQSDVTFTAEVTDENILEVRLEIQECNANTQICYPKQNLSMTEVSTGTYESTVTLQHADATYIQYTLKIKTTDGWDEYFKETKVNLSEKPSNGDTNGDKNGNTNEDTPGFEFVGLALSVMFIMFILYKRKR